jgi:hypothetical protein
VVLVLRGRQEPWPEEGEYGTDWPELPWSGTRFRVEAVYQRTVAELLSEAFAEQTGRPPTPEEQTALAKRAQELGAKHALRALFKLHGDALVTWLLGSRT